MKSFKIKLTSSVIMIFIALAMLNVGIFAAETQSIKLNGTVNFDIKDKCLYVQDVRLQESMDTSPYSLKEQSRFMPGYINENFSLNLGSFTNNYGSFALYFDVINLIVDNENYEYEVSAESSQSDVNVEVILLDKNNSQIDYIPKGSLKPEEITQSSPISATINVAISTTQSATVDLSAITIKISQYSTPITITVNENNKTMGTATGGGDYRIGETVSIQASLNSNMVFFGWEDENGDIISNEPNYSFVLSENSSTTYTALFDNSHYENDTNPTYYTVDIANPNDDGGYHFSIGADFESIFTDTIYFPSVVNIDGINYLISSISGGAYDIGMDVSNLVFPSTVKSITDMNIYSTTIIFAKNSKLQAIENVNFNSESLVLSEIPASLTSIINVTLNSTTIDSITFEENSKLSRVELTVYSYILNDIVFTSLEPPTSVNVEFYGNLFGNIYVPDESIEEYKTAFSEMSNKIFKLSEYV